MESPILQTKLYLPQIRSTDLVPRSRLIGRLNEGLYRKLTLISAPAGFGKTTLVSEWIDQAGDSSTSQHQFSWLSLGKEDNDIARFFTYFMAALQIVHFSAHSCDSVPPRRSGLLGQQ